MKDHETTGVAMPCLARLTPLRGRKNYFTRYSSCLLVSNMSDKSDRDNHSNQGNPNNDAYWESRGLDERADDWETRIDGDDDPEDKDNDW